MFKAAEKLVTPLLMTESPIFGLNGIIYIFNIIYEYKANLTTMSENWEKRVEFVFN